jgi:hypothetical protein
MEMIKLFVKELSGKTRIRSQERIQGRTYKEVFNRADLFKQKLLLK